MFLPQVNVCAVCGQGLYVTLKVSLREGKGVELSWWKESILALTCPIIHHRSLRRRYYYEIPKVFSFLRQCGGDHPPSSNNEQSNVATMRSTVSK